VWDKAPALSLRKAEPYATAEPSVFYIDLNITDVYLIWSVSGHVKLRVTRGTGVNAVVNGVFFR
jgi:hypothetical protein